MKRHSKQDAAVTAANKKANTPKRENTQKRKKLERARQLAYLIHDDLHLTFGQCVQLILTNYTYGHVIANRNICEFNLAHADNKNVAVLGEKTISLFDEGTFNTLLAKKLEWAASAVQSNA